MNIAQAIISVCAVFFLHGCAHADEARSAALTPNYCARMICLEIDQLSGNGVEVETISRKSKTETSIRSELGTTTVAAELVAHGSCDVTKVVRLSEETGGGYRGSACLVPPDKAGVVKVEVSFLPTNPTARAGASAPIGFPIFGIWAVDPAPVSFWKKGYALRLGTVVSFSW